MRFLREECERNIRTKTGSGFIDRVSMITVLLLLIKILCLQRARIYNYNVTCSFIRTTIQDHQWN